MLSFGVIYSLIIRICLSHCNSHLFPGQNCALELKALKKTARETRSVIDIIGMNVERLCRAILPGEKVLKRPPSMPAFPLTSVEEVEVMEKFLKNDANLSSAVSVNVNAVTGHALSMLSLLMSVFLILSPQANYYARNLKKGDLEGSVRNLMSIAVSKELSAMYTFTGVGEKMAFNGTEIWRMIEGMGDNQCQPVLT